MTTAIYGIDFYGVGRYGAPAFVDFDASPFSAHGIGHDSLLVSWRTPTGAWDRLRLVRDTYGYPNTADLGTVLLDLDVTVPTSTYLDAGLTSGTFYYYSLFLRSTVDGTWVRAGNTTGLVVKDFGYGDRLFALTPWVFREMDAGLPESIFDTGPLQRFLQLLGFQLDHIRSEYESLLWLNDPNKVAGGLLPLMASQFGFGWESELGMRLARLQMRNAVHLYKIKGTRLGVEGFGSVMTGWDTRVALSPNLLLDQDDASVEHSLGRWTALTNCSLSRRNVATPPTIAGPVPVPTGASIGDIGSGDWFMQMTATAAGDMEAVLATGTGLIPAAPNLYGVPVTAGTQYTFSMHARADATLRSVYVRMHFYDITGTFISSFNGVATSEVAAAWYRASVTAVAPAGAVWAAFSVYVVGVAAGGIHYWDAAQMEVGAAPTAYQSARDVRIKFYPNRWNYALNPGFEVDLATWAATTNCTIARSTTAGTFVFGTSSMRMTATAAGTMQATETVPATAGTTWTLSAHFLTAVTARAVRVILQFLDGSNAVLSTTNGLTVNDATTGINRPFVTARAPVGTVNARLITEVQAPAAGEIHYVDAVLFEPTNQVLAYFDGSTFSNEAEYMWGGTAMNSISYYYRRRTIKNFRLNQRLVEFLPAGATYTLLYAVP